MKTYFTIAPLPDEKGIISLPMYHPRIAERSGFLEFFWGPKKQGLYWIDKRWKKNSYIQVATLLPQGE